MALASLPKEIRLEIWSLAYFAQPPRLVALRTKSHERHYDNNFCPRYSPSPAPTVVNVCKEARAEAHYQARKAGHMVQLRHGPLTVAAPEEAQFTEEFYFRFETDILYLPLEDINVKHFDDSPEVGFLRHFRAAVGCDPLQLRKIAVTKVIPSGYNDGSFSNVLRKFPHISHMFMMVPNGMWEDRQQKALLVGAARRIVRMYDIDMGRDIRDVTSPSKIQVDFAALVKGELALVPRAMWKDWSEQTYDRIFIGHTP
ncbi:hypothetical protein BDU57DRAFT_552342 [Ampelomyces quisqualis]|uniref:2EXR domain-containing protein n=1 Tax=Ampelomyces quisqualis TaxID=50730 RepID=A0A6A5Q894_AMPQU|nr:hypothetical protein BDU57DRAFT_552342 [Ampelomyces quisqualis]